MDQAITAGIIELLMEQRQQYFAVLDRLTGECVATVIKMSDVEFAVTEIQRHFDFPDQKVPSFTVRVL